MLLVTSLKKFMPLLIKRYYSLCIYFAGAFVAAAFNSASQIMFLKNFCIDKTLICRMASALAATVVGFCIKFLWDNFIVFGNSKVSSSRKGFLFLASSAFITFLYLVIIFFLSLIEVTDTAFTAFSCLCFFLGYLLKYFIDKKYVFAVQSK